MNNKIGIQAFERLQQADGSIPRPGSCKKCGRVGHLTYECLNDIKLPPPPPPKKTIYDHAIKPSSENDTAESKRHSERKGKSKKKKSKSDKKKDKKKRHRRRSPSTSSSSSGEDRKRRSKKGLLHLNTIPGLLAKLNLKEKPSENVLLHHIIGGQNTHLVLIRTPIRYDPFVMMTQVKLKVQVARISIPTGLG
ncbi:hypothetical protein DSO57_1033550 [Entomophthora muscae]|uniref:Uncharacterized protein n=1 Tax=Entomophthora muscae TaxID=34485 RepID=A0ACC2TB49_9FUNG|nr:hypothetical protein DSO57_1033550 [Entomophthora muscae]